MKKHNTLCSGRTLIFAFVILFIISSYFFLFKNNSNFSSGCEDKFSIKGDDSLLFKEENETGSSTNAEEYFSKWFYPYGNYLPPDIIEQIQSQIKKMPSENYTGEEDSWHCIGPYGIKHGTESYYSGRILSIEQPVSPGYGLRIGSSTGGLWEYENSHWVPLSDNIDNINSLSISAFATKPDDGNIIFIGTGDFKDFAGSGLWKTTDKGRSWSNVALDPEPTFFSRIKFSTSNHDVIHISSDVGYFRSDDAGNTWTRKLSGRTTCLAINPNNKILYTGIFGDGLYRSTNEGNNWSKLTAGGIPTSNIGKVAISIAASNPKVVYAAITTNNKNNPAGDTLQGIYKTTDDGESWSDVRSNVKYIPWTGDYFNEIAVDPKNPNIVIAAAIEMVRTTDGGKNWTKVNSIDVHMDHKALLWSVDGKTLWDCNDGGLSVTTNEGVNWNTETNVLPITQFYYFDIGDNNHNVIAGGVQDNGFIMTTDGGYSWNFKLGGDGGGASIDPGNTANIFGAIYTDIYVSSDNGVKFTKTTSGKDDCKGNPRLSAIRNDRGNPPVFYTICSKYVYYTKNLGKNWMKLNESAFSQNVNNIRVTPHSAQYPSVVYACFQGRPKPDPVNKLKVYDKGEWYERSSGLPASADVRTVSLPYTGYNTAYALMDGLSSPGEKIFKTTNRGINWENITGDLPEMIAVGDLFPNPADPDKLFLGTAFGFFRSTNGGLNWERWNNGMPGSLIISELKYIDSTSHNGKFYIAAATYGRGIWIRNINDNDASDMKNPEQENTKIKNEKNNIENKGSKKK